LNRAIHWRKIKQEVHLLRRLCSMESYPDAAAAFQREYLFQQSEQFGKDLKAIADHIRIPLDSVEKILRSKQENE
jgi:hypothetical protein